MNKLFQLIIKYKILHVIYWVWVIISFLHYRQERFGGTLLSQLPVTLIIYIFQMIVVYSLLYYFVPHFLNRQKYFQFSGLIFILLLAGSVLSSVAVMLYYYLIYKELLNNFLVMTFSQTVDMVLVVLIFLSADIIYSRYKNDLRNRRIEKRKT